MNQTVRAPYAAGKFYTGNAEKLRQQILDFKVQAETVVTPLDGVRAVILPHAGYDYSAVTAVKTLVRAGAGNFSRFLLLAPSHRVPFRGAAYAKYQSYHTPLGNVKIDQNFLELASRNESSYFHELPAAHENEHSLEVELPLLQVLRPDLTIMPLIAGFVDAPAAEHLAVCLAEYWQPDVLWVISSDFTHYGAAFNYMPFAGDIRQNLRDLDYGAIEHILKFDLDGFNHYVGRTGATICGAGPIRILLAAARNAIATGSKLEAEVVEYTTSGELTGDFSHCVSYAGITVRDKAADNTTRVLLTGKHHDKTISISSCRDR
jgi:AmmeMemoRadiSam system protein B